MNQTIQLGPYTAKLWRGRDARWKWHSYQDGRRVLHSAAELDTAKRRALDHLRALRDGRSALLEADPATVSEFLAWRAARIASPPMADGVTRYLAHLEARGVAHTRIIKSDLDKFAIAHPQRMAEIQPDHIAAYLAAQTVGPRRKNNIRAALVSLYRWARMQGLVPDTTTAPERTHASALPLSPVAIYTPSQLRSLLSAAPADWKLGLAIGAWAGLRSEEIAGLRWEDLLTSRKLILVRAEICKTGRRRFVPIQPALAALIKKSKAAEGGMIIPRERIDVLARRLRRRGVTWIKNGLRHSYGSYRCAIVKSAGQVALEMGNSETVVRRHYLEVQDQPTAVEWFDGGSISAKTPAKPDKT